MGLVLDLVSRATAVIAARICRHVRTLKCYAGDLIASVSANARARPWSSVAAVWDAREKQAEFWRIWREHARRSARYWSV